MKRPDLIIVGSGAAGLAAALYAGRYKMGTLVIGKEFGGETAKAGLIENYSGVEAIEGFSLMAIMKKQAESLGVEILDAEASAVSRRGHCFQVSAAGQAYQANTIILAAGAERRRLGLTNEQALTGRGVHYCVTCDGPVYNGKTIALAGGGDASVKGAIFAAEYVKKIFLLVRGKQILAEPINLERLKALGNKIEVLTETEVKEIIGRKKFEKIRLSKPYQGSEELKVDGLFIEIGAIPNVKLAQDLGVALDERGYIKVDNLMRTNVDGVFAAGDAVNHFGAFKQVITAAAMGAVAATSAYNDHKNHGELCDLHAVPSGNK